MIKIRESTVKHNHLYDMAHSFRNIVEQWRNTVILLKLCDFSFDSVGHRRVEQQQLEMLWAK